MARAPGLADAVHAGPPRQPARPAVPGAPDHYPTRDEVVAYLTDYARDLPVAYGTRATALRRAASGYEVETAAGTLAAGQVVVATGPPATVIWAAGFGTDHPWIDVPVFGADGRLLHRRGVTPSPGLHVLGLPWLHTRGSALLGWVRDDAESLAARIAEAPRPASGIGSGSHLGVAA